MNNSSVDQTETEIHLPLTGGSAQDDRRARTAIGIAVTRMCMELQDRWPETAHAGQQLVATRQAFLDGLYQLSEDAEYADMTVVQIINLLQYGRR